VDAGAQGDYGSSTSPWPSGPCGARDRLSRFVAVRRIELTAGETVDRFTHELLEWISLRPRTYPESIDAWRSTCPRHSVWDDALTDGLVRIDARRGLPADVVLTQRGRELLDRPS
jgi:hypothetical protein